MIEPLEPRTFFSVSPAIINSEVTLLGRLPGASLVAGHSIRPLVQYVRITNTGATPIAGKTQIALKLSSDPGGSAAGPIAADVTRSLNIKPGHRVTIALAIRRLPAQQTGALFILVEVTDSAGDIARAASVGTITVVPPTVDLAPVKLIVPTTARISRSTVVRVIVENNGNTAAIGPLMIDLQASTTRAIDTNSLDLGIDSRHVAIGAGRKIILSLPVMLPTTGGPYFIVANVDPGNTFAETTLGNNEAVSAAAISRAPVVVGTVGTMTIKLSRLATVPAADGTPQDIVTAPGVLDHQFVSARMAMF